MTRNFAPGDVAMIRVGTGDWEYGLLREDGVWLCQHPRLDERRAWEEVQVRPLVVIDPEGREQVERLVEELCEGQWGHRWGKEQVDKMQAALREFADPKPRIEEPTGLGAVVEDADGKRWVCTGDVDSGGSWWMSGSEPERWPDLNVVRVLSEGVTS